MTSARSKICNEINFSRVMAIVNRVWDDRLNVKIFLIACSVFIMQ